MASRKEQKEQARQARIAQQEQAAAKAQRSRRLQVFGGAIAIAVIVIVVAVVISTSGGGGSNLTKINPKSSAAKAAVAHVDKLLAGIPQAGNTLGNPKAKVTITEWGDLECSVCDVLTARTSFKNPEGETGSGWLDQLITDYVRPGKAKLVYKSLETASGSNPDRSAFERQQVAAYAAGLQNKAWYYIELMYNQQGKEGTNYVTENYLQTLAKQIKGLDFKMWMADRKLTTFKPQITLEQNQAATIDKAVHQLVSTPTIVISGPKGTATPIVGLPQNGYSGYTSAINVVG